MDNDYLERRIQKCEDGVQEYIKDQRFLLTELKRVGEGLDKLYSKINAIDTRLAMQEVKSGLLGGAGGAIVIAVKWLLTGK